MKKTIIISLITLLVISFGCKTNSVTTTSQSDIKTVKETSKREHSVQALLWQQRAAEYKALCHQAYNIAKLRIDALANKQHIKPIAIVTDIDETVLDNSPYNARMVKSDSGYTSKSWISWGKERRARVVPGALDFFNYANKKGVTIFYLSNRYNVQKSETIDNLKKAGFPNVDETHVLLRTNSSGKQARRDIISKTHQIVMLLGDNLSDFSEDFDKQPSKKRNALVLEKKKSFGNNFIVFPNPMYGDWENKGIYESSYKWTDKQKDSIRKAKLLLN